MVVTENAVEKQFEAVVEDMVIKIDYIRTKSKIFLTHTEVPERLSGQGYATELVGRVLEMVREMSLDLVPLCPFVAAYIKNHPEYQSLLAAGYHV